MDIGRIVHTLEDESRVELYNNQVRNRTFVISIYYPGRAETVDELYVYKDLFHPVEEEALHVLKGLGMSEEVIHTMKIPVSKMVTAQDAVKHPVIIYSPAFGVDRDMYQYYVNQLVQNGYVVVTVSAPYESVLTVFPNGDFINQTSEIANISGTDFPALNTIKDTRIRDLQYTIDYLAQLNENHASLKGILDLEQLSVIGHSLGGAAVYEVAMRDERIKFCILCDASLHLLSIGESLNAQCAILSLRQEASSYVSLKQVMSEQVASAIIEAQKRLYAQEEVSKTFIKICDAEHMTFSDVPLLMGGSNLAITSMHNIINNLSLSFLKGESLFSIAEQMIGFMEIDGEGNACHYEAD